MRKKEKQKLKRLDLETLAGFGEISLRRAPVVDLLPSTLKGSIRHLPCQSPLCPVYAFNKACHSRTQMH
jgi:hypothetical protein